MSLLGGALSYEDLLRIAGIQVEREYAAATPTTHWLVCDTALPTTLSYSLADHGRAEPRPVELARRRHDLNLLCAQDFPFEQDGTRRDAAFRARQHEWCRERLAEQGARALRVHGPLDARVGRVLLAMDVVR